MITVIREVVDFDQIQGTESVSWHVYNCEDIYDLELFNEVHCFDYEDAHELANEYQRKYKTIDIVEVD